LLSSGPRLAAAQTPEQVWWKQRNRSEPDVLLLLLVDDFKAAKQLKQQHEQKQHDAWVRVCAAQIVLDNCRAKLGHVLYAESKTH
jgi:Leu/Phe-tRNA-protein transferase